MEQDKPNDLHYEQVIFLTMRALTDLTAWGYLEVPGLTRILTPKGVAEADQVMDNIVPSQEEILFILREVGLIDPEEEDLEKHDSLFALIEGYFQKELPEQQEGASA